MIHIQNVFLFDLDGTLIDSVYQHVLSWMEALNEEGVELSIWRIHRKIGMSGGLFADQLLRETGLEITPELLDRLRRHHAEAYRRNATRVRPLPGAIELLATLTEAGTPWAIATSGRMETAAPNIAALGIDPTKIPVVTRDQVSTPSRIRICSWPPPNGLAHRSRMPWWSATASGTCWPSRRCRALGVGLLSGGYGQDELGAQRRGQGV